ncbi:MAG TPA: hypothetical protein VII74_06830, partial [Chthoniobacterales bacterium]
MSTSTKSILQTLAALLVAASPSFGQDAGTTHATSASTPAGNSDITPMTLVQAAPATAAVPSTASPPAAAPMASPTMNIAAATTAAPPANAAGAQPAAASASSEAQSVTENGGVGVREFQGDEVGQVLRLLARQAKINVVVSDAAAASGTVTMRLEDVTALQSIKIIVKAKNLFMDDIDNVYYIKTAAERTAEPTESGSYQFSYANAKDIEPLLASQLLSKQAPQIDTRTNTVFYRENRSNVDAIRKLLVDIDKPTRQVMIEARLVEVTANPQQSYGINWAGVVGSASSPQTIRYGSYNPAGGAAPAAASGTTISTTDFGHQVGSAIGSLIGGQFAILSVPQMSATLRFLNEDQDTEFLANPRIVTADNMKATIKIIRSQPVAQETFNEQTAQSVFSGFQDKEFGNTLEVTPSVNKDDFVTLSVKPVISNKVGDQSFTPPGGAPILSPIIDTRSLDSNVLIKSGDTLAIGGLLQDEVTKSRTKVPIVGDIPLLGNLFQEHLN